MVDERGSFFSYFYSYSQNLKDFEKEQPTSGGSPDLDEGRNVERHVEFVSLQNFVRNFKRRNNIAVKIQNRNDFELIKRCLFQRGGCSLMAKRRPVEPVKGVRFPSPTLKTVCLIAGKPS